MAKNEIDPEKTYRVVLRRVIEIAPQVFVKPTDDFVVKGKVLATILDAVERYEDA